MNLFQVFEDRETISSNWGEKNMRLSGNVHLVLVLSVLLVSSCGKVPRTDYAELTAQDREMAADWTSQDDAQLTTKLGWYYTNESTINTHKSTILFEN